MGGRRWPSPHLRTFISKKTLSPPQPPLSLPLSFKWTSSFKLPSHTLFSKSLPFPATLQELFWVFLSFYIAVSRKGKVFLHCMFWWRSAIREKWRELKNIIWLHWVLVVTHETFFAVCGLSSCAMPALYLQGPGLAALQQVGSSSPTRNWTHIPYIARRILNLQIPREVLYHFNAQSLSGDWLCNPVDYSPPVSSVHGTSRQEYWSGLLFPSPGDLPDPGPIGELLMTDEWVLKWKTLFAPLNEW